VYTTYLVPLDGSPLAERALPYALALARAAHGRLILLHVTGRTVLGRTDGRAVEALAESARAIAPEVAVEARVCEATGGEDTGRALAAAARRLDADAIVMATHGRSAPERLVYGSVADQVLRCAGTPLLLVPPGAGQCWPEGRLRRILVPLDGSAFAEAALLPAAALPRGPEAELLLLRAPTGGAGSPA
jgi:nucleotide-binding universal stress UspA family protein